MNEQLKKIDSQDENKSQSMDERMFVDNNIRKKSVVDTDENGESIFKKISVSEKRLNESNHNSNNGGNKDKKTEVREVIDFRKCFFFIKV